MGCGGSQAASEKKELEKKLEEEKRKVEQLEEERKSTYFAPVSNANTAAGGGAAAASPVRTKGISNPDQAKEKAMLALTKSIEDKNRDQFIEAVKQAYCVQVTPEELRNPTSPAVRKTVQNLGMIKDHKKFLETMKEELKDINFVRVNCPYCGAQNESVFDASKYKFTEVQLVCGKCYSDFSYAPGMSDSDKADTAEMGLIGMIAALLVIT